MRKGKSIGPGLFIVLLILALILIFRMIYIYQTYESAGSAGQAMKEASEMEAFPERLDVPYFHA